MSLALSFTCAYTYAPPPPPHTHSPNHAVPLLHHVAMHYWRLGVAAFLPAESAYIYISCRRCCSAISLSPARHPSQPSCYLDLDETAASVQSRDERAKAGRLPPPPPPPLANVKAKRNKAAVFLFFFLLVVLFYRSKEAVSESSSLSACIPSISRSASWTTIRRQVPAVISEQQRGGAALFRIVWCRRASVNWKVWSCRRKTSHHHHHQVLSSSRFCLLRAGSNVEQAPASFSLFIFGSGFAACNVSQYIKSRKGIWGWEGGRWGLGGGAHAFCLFYSGGHCVCVWKKNPPLCISGAAPTASLFDDAGCWEFPHNKSAAIVRLTLVITRQMSDEKTKSFCRPAGNQ